MASYQQRALRHTRGSALSLIILLTVVITGLVMTLAYSSGFQAAQVTGFRASDNAFFAAEAGIQTLYWEVKHKKITTTSTLTGTVPGGTFTGTATLQSDGSFTLNSVGNYAAANSTVTGVCAPTNTAALSVGGNLALALTNIGGDVVVMGKVNQGLASATLLTGITGKLASAGTVAMLGSNGATTLKLLGIIPVANATNGFYQNQTGLSKPSALAYYQAQASTHPVNQLAISALFSFDVANDYGGTLHLSSTANITALTVFKGPGTVIIDGDLTGALCTFGTPAAPVNVIVKGNCALVGATINGSLWIGGNYTPALAGALTVNGGSIVVDGDVTLGLLSSLTVTNAPTAGFQLQNFNGIN